MRGELTPAWPESWKEIWEPLSADGSPSDLFCELYRELTSALNHAPTVEELADIVDSAEDSRHTFQSVATSDFMNEEALAGFFERAFDVCEDLGGDGLSNTYFGLLEDFIMKFNLRYDLRRPCDLCPTVPGVFAGLFSALRTMTSQDVHLLSLMRDFESSVRDLRRDGSDTNIKTCIAKQTNLLEGLGGAHSLVTTNTLGAMCDQVGSWPHESLRDAMKSIYKFACNYPGIRHGGTPSSALREIDMRDLVAVSIVLTGFSTYLTELDTYAGYKVL